MVGISPEDQEDPDCRQESTEAVMGPHATTSVRIPLKSSTKNIQVSFNGHEPEMIK